MKIGFDNDKYLALQAEHIKERRSQFGDSRKAPARGMRHR